VFFNNEVYDVNWIQKIHGWQLFYKQQSYSIRYSADKNVYLHIFKNNNIVGEIIYPNEVLIDGSITFKLQQELTSLESKLICIIMLVLCANAFNQSQEGNPIEFIPFFNWFIG
jgi:hypothetical protein